MRDEELLALRPTIDTLPGAGVVEAFQNETLRPILKLQHALLAAAWRRYVDRQKGSFDGLLGSAARREYLRHALHTNRELRAFVCGLVCGMFTLEEWDAFRQNEGELTRRLITMAEARLAEGL